MKFFKFNKKIILLPFLFFNLSSYAQSEKINFGLLSETQSIYLDNLTISAATSVTLFQLCKPSYATQAYQYAYHNIAQKISEEIPKELNKIAIDYSIDSFDRKVRALKYAYDKKSCGQANLENLAELTNRYKFPIPD